MDAMPLARVANKEIVSMSASYDLIAIGTGTAAKIVAMRARAAKWRVAIIDSRPFGGTCALRGCDPKKMMIQGAKALDHARRMQGKGVNGEISLDWAELIRFKRGFTDPIPDKHEQSFEGKGIDAYHGLARFTGPNHLQVNDTDLEGRHILIASGAEPVTLGIPGQEHLLSSDEFLELPSLPPRIALVGGGYIAAEFSHLAARAGAEVTVLQRGERMLKPFDPDLVDWLMASFREQGIDVRTQTHVEAIKKTGSGYRVRTSSNGVSDSVEADLVVHAAGRVPAIQALNLEAAGIEMHKGRLVLNEYLQSTSNPSIYAAGDAAQVGPPLTPVSSHDAKVVAANLIDGKAVKPDYSGVPSVAFTIPPIASAGLTEAQAREQDLRFRVESQRTPDWFTARQAAETVYGHKLLIEEGSERILGAHLVGPNVDEVSISLLWPFDSSSRLKPSRRRCSRIRRGLLISDRCFKSVHSKGYGKRWLVRDRVFDFRTDRSYFEDECCFALLSGLEREKFLFQGIKHKASIVHEKQGGIMTTDRETSARDKQATFLPSEQGTLDYSEKTALLVIDPVNDFLSEGGAAWDMTKGTVQKNDVVLHIKQAIQGARERGIPVLFGPMAYTEEDYAKHLQRRSGINRIMFERKMFLAGSWGADFHPELQPEPGDTVLRPHKTCDVFETDLPEQLEARGITKLVIAGMTANMCCESTGRRAVEKGYDVTYLSDAIGSENLPSYEAAIRINFPMFGNAVITVSEFLAAVEASLQRKLDIQTGDKVIGSDHGKIGTVDDVVVAHDTYADHIKVNVGVLGSDLYIPLEAVIHRGDGTLFVNIPKLVASKMPWQEAPTHEGQAEKRGQSEKAVTNLYGSVSPSGGIGG
jgi:glutathione reductase (NADPH)